MNDHQEIRRELRELPARVQKELAKVRKNVQESLDRIRRITGPPDSAA